MISFSMLHGVKRLGEMFDETQFVMHRLHFAYCSSTSPIYEYL